MIDLLIFGFGLAVVLIVGSALAILITANNRDLDRTASAAVSSRVAQVRAAK